MPFYYPYFIENPSNYTSSKSPSINLFLSLFPKFKYSMASL